MELEKVTHILSKQITNPQLFLRDGNPRNFQPIARLSHRCCEQIAHPDNQYSYLEHQRRIETVLPLLEFFLEQVDCVWVQPFWAVGNCWLSNQFPKDDLSHSGRTTTHAVVLLQWKVQGLPSLWRFYQVVQLPGTYGQNSCENHHSQCVQSCRSRPWAVQCDPWATTCCLFP